ncbi:MAG: lipid II:glycine glycyltransferase FemX, partial [Anaerolineales bacterium]
MNAHPHGHILQTHAWGQLKSAFGWRAETVCAGGQGALVLLRSLPLPPGRPLAYVPRGPLADWEDAAALGDLVQALDSACRARRAICLKIEPDLPDSAACADTLTALGFRPSPQAVQPRRTLVVDLSGSEAEILARMKPKTRYNIGLARKKNITIRAAQSNADLETFIELVSVTGARDHFGVHSAAYYRTAYGLFHPPGQCELLLAGYQGEV